MSNLLLMSLTDLISLSLSCVYVCVWLCAHVFVYSCVYISVCLCVCVCLCPCMCLYVWVCMCVYYGCWGGACFCLAHRCQKLKADGLPLWIFNIGFEIVSHWTQIPTFFNRLVSSKLPVSTCFSHLSANVIVLCWVTKLFPGCCDSNIHPHNFMERTISNY